MGQANAGFVCIGVPFFLGEREESRHEVAEIRASGLAEQIGAPWVDLMPDFNAAPHPVAAVNRALASTIQAHAPRLPLVFASDCTSALGMVKALGPDLSVLWYDAHGDFNTPATSPSGFLGGMPLAMLVGRGNDALREAVGLAPLDERAIILTDARDLDPAEAEALAASAITHLPSVSDLLTAPLPTQPLYVHLDLDVIDPDEMPGHGYPAPNGPGLSAVRETLARVGQHTHPAGILFSLWNSTLAADDRPLEGLIALVQTYVDAVR